ncbi:MAG: chorismate synthase [Acidaminococcaceae bacterium]
MSSSYGEKIKVTIFGESHGPSLGLVIDGLPPGVALNLEEVAREMRRRAPGQNTFSTPRQETDAFHIQSGWFEGKTTGTPLCALVYNEDTRSQDYTPSKDVLRPSHADYTGRVKYQGFNDYRGGGSFSGRLTAPLVFVGAIAKQILALRGITLGAHIVKIGQVTERRFNPLGESPTTLRALTTQTLPVLEKQRGREMAEVIVAAGADHNSVGGSVECMAVGLPVGLGEPFFDSVESKLAHALFAIPAVKGVEFGLGFGLTGLTGSEANDQMCFVQGQVQTLTNQNGGILGGITNGMPLVLQVGFKPTPSIAQPQQTVNVATGTNEIITIAGRHDPCIVPRAVPVVEGVTAWVLLDLLLLAENKLVV